MLYLLSIIHTVLNYGNMQDERDITSYIYVHIHIHYYDDPSFLHFKSSLFSEQNVIPSPTALKLINVANLRLEK
jgi:hypothetical protein